MPPMYIVLLVVCLAGSALCQDDEARDQLHKKFFDETEPQLERDELMQMLQDLKKLYDKESDEYKVINELLIYSEVSESNCKNIFFMDRATRYRGHGNHLVNESRRLQSKVCKDLWERTLATAIASLDTNIKEIVSSIAKSMVDANGGMDFEGNEFQMPHENAQEGVVRFMEHKTGGTFSAETKKEDFDKAFDEWISEPCGQVINKLFPISNMYVEFPKRTSLVSYELDPTALEWAKYGEICKSLRGFGYVSPKQWSFKKETFEHLTHRKGEIFWFKGENSSSDS